MFESGNFEDQEKSKKRKEPINIEGRPAARNLRERFEKGLSLQEDEEGRDDEHREVDHVFREAGMSYSKLIDVHIFLVLIVVII